MYTLDKSCTLHFRLSNNLYQYLSNVSSKFNMSKSAYLVSLLESDMCNGGHIHANRKTNKHNKLQ